MDGSAVTEWCEGNMDSDLDTMTSCTCGMSSEACGEISGEISVKNTDSGILETPQEWVMSPKRAKGESRARRHLRV